MNESIYWWCKMCRRDYKPSPVLQINLTKPSGRLKQGNSFISLLEKPFSKAFDFFVWNPTDVRFIVFSGRLPWLCSSWQRSHSVGWSHFGTSAGQRWQMPGLSTLYLPTADHLLPFVPYKNCFKMFSICMKYVLIW